MPFHFNTGERDIEIIEEENSKNISKKLSRKDRRKLEPIARKLIKTIFHFFPKFKEHLNEIKDPRNQKKIKYPLEVIMWCGLFIFILQLKARRQVHYSLGSDEGLENIKNSLGFDKLPHGDTVRDTLEKVPVEELEKLRLKLVRILLRKKSLSAFRLLNKYYLIAVDGTELYKFKKRHCKHCLERNLSSWFKITEETLRKLPNKIDIEKLKPLINRELSRKNLTNKLKELRFNKKEVKLILDHSELLKEEIQYYHKVLEAKLVFPNGISISVDTEFVENEDPNVKKQDCETKAFYRLSARLKKNFPQLRICLLLDSLYPQQEVLNICKNNNWRYIIGFKGGCIPSVYEEFEALSKLQKENSYNLKKTNIEQAFRWVSDIEYKGHFLYALELVEVEFYKKTGQEKEKRYFLWLTDFKINKINYLHIANYGGRMRWKIENEGFNQQKNGGYNLEHVYAHDYNAMKNFYILLQLGHFINQLFLKGSLMGKEMIKKFGGIKNIMKKLRAQFIHSYTDFTGLQEYLKTPIQIRFY